MRLFIAFILLLIFTNLAFARESKVRCPDIETLRQSSNAISDASFVNDSYIATTQPFAILTADIGWFAVVYNIQAASVNDAINKARLAMLAVSSLSNKFAEDFAGIYVCKYDNDKIEVINNDANWRR